MNLTLSIDDDLLEKARKRTNEMGTSVNQYVRDILQNLVGEGDLEAQIAWFEQTSGLGTPDANYKFDRDEVYAERLDRYGKS